MNTDFHNFFIARTRNLWRIKVRLRRPPHLYFVITIPSKTHTAGAANTIAFDAEHFEVYSKQFSSYCILTYYEIVD